MPYLPDDFREEIKKHGGKEHFDYMCRINKDEDWAGAVNHNNYRILVDRMYREKGTWGRYWKFAMWVGTMICCVLEAYRKIIGPYEDCAIQRNGDIE